MSFFNRFKNYGFWVSLSAALIVLLNAFGNAFGFKIENQIVEDIVLSVAGLLVVFGVVTMNKPNDNNPDENDDDKQE